MHKKKLDIFSHPKFKLKFKFKLKGRLSDLTNTRFGRRRPWIAVGALPFAISYFFLWMVFPGSSQIFDFFYYLFFLIIYNTFYSVESVPHLALVPEMTNDDKTRTELVSFRLVTFVVAALFSTTIHGILIRAFEPRLGYFLSACFFSFIFIFPPIICSIFCKVIIFPPPFFPPSTTTDPGQRKQQGKKKSCLERNQNNHHFFQELNPL